MSRPRCWWVVTVAKFSPKKLLVALVALLTACGDLSGIDPEARIAVPPSFSTYLPSTAIRPYSQLVATALRDQKLPALADYTSYKDWQIRLGITQSSGMATPVFTLIDPAGSDQGRVQGRLVPIESWKRGQQETMRQAAADAAPRMAALFNKVVAERRQAADRATRERELAERQRQIQQLAQSNRPMRVVITGITGAPTDGNRVLARLLREKLLKLGEVVQDTGSGADFSVRAKVEDVAVDDKTRRLEIFWLIHNARNQEVGEIVQLNEVPVGSLDRGWGELAVSVADEAAGAIHDVILTQLGRR